MIKTTLVALASAFAMAAIAPAFAQTTAPAPQAPTAVQQDNQNIPARVKVVVASVMQPTVEYRYQPNASL